MIRSPQSYLVYVSLDNHDIISMKLYQLTVDRTADEEEEEVTIPSVDNMEQFQGNRLFFHSPSLLNVSVDHGPISMKPGSSCPGGLIWSWSLMSVILLLLQ